MLEGSSFRAALRAVNFRARLSELLLVLVALLIASVAITSASAADFPPQPAGNLNSPAQPTNQSPSQPSAIQQVTHTQAEPPRLAANTERSLALPPLQNSTAENPSSGTRTLGAIVSVIGSLAVVLALFLGLAWLMRRGMPNAARRLPDDVVHVLGRVPLAGRQQMHVLRFGNKLLLVCALPSGVDTLGEITDPVEIDRLAGLCAETETYSASTAFKQIFGQLARQIDHENH